MKNKKQKVPVIKKNLKEVSEIYPPFLFVVL